MFGHFTTCMKGLKSSVVDEGRNILEHRQIKMVGGNIKDT